MIPKIQSDRATFIDAGGKLGWAVFQKRFANEAKTVVSGWQLSFCGLFRADITESRKVINHIPWTPVVVVEVPQFEKGDTPKRINDLFVTTRRGAEVAGALRPDEVHYVHPHEWKGSVPKEIHNARTLAKLFAEERVVVDNALWSLAKSLHNNVIDAIGLGLVCVGRW